MARFEALVYTLSNLLRRQAMLDAYRDHQAERAAQGIPAKPLSAE